MCLKFFDLIRFSLIYVFPVWMSLLDLSLMTDLARVQKEHKIERIPGGFIQEKLVRQILTSKL